MPKHEEWMALTDYIGGVNSPHGNELKSCMQVNSPLGWDCNTSEHPRWDEDIYNANYGTDDYGFSGLPGGLRDYSGSFYVLGFNGQWWSSSANNDVQAWNSLLRHNYGNLYVSFVDKRKGYSVRCIRD